MIFIVWCYDRSTSIYATEFYMCKVPQRHVKTLSSTNKSNPSPSSSLCHPPHSFLPVPILLIPIPIRQHVCDPWTVRQLIHLLEILLRERKRLGRDVGNVLANQLARVDCRPVDLLQQETSERLDAGPEESAVKRHIDALERDGGKPALQIERLRLGLCLLDAFANNLDEVGFDLLERHGLHERLDIDVLGLEVVGHVGQGIESPKLVLSLARFNSERTGGTYIASTNVLRVGNIEVDNLDKPSSNF